MGVASSCWSFHHAVAIGFSLDSTSKWDSTVDMATPIATGILPMPYNAHQIYDDLLEPRIRGSSFLFQGGGRPKPIQTYRFCPTLRSFLHPFCRLWPEQFKPICRDWKRTISVVTHSAKADLLCLHHRPCSCPFSPSGKLMLFPKWVKSLSSSAWLKGGS